jgi:hypothetical protein
LSDLHPNFGDLLRKSGLDRFASFAILNLAAQGLQFGDELIDLRAEDAESECLAEWSIRTIAGAFQLAHWRKEGAGRALNHEKGQLKPLNLLFRRDIGQLDSPL